MRQPPAPAPQPSSAPSSPTRRGPSPGSWAEYGELVRGNRPFRYLWGSSVVSLFGDWFNTIATLTLVERLSDSPLATGIVFVVKMLSMAVASPMAGVIADRYDRRSLLIGSDLIRFVIVLGFLFVDSRADLPLLYTLVGLQMAVGSVFRPAKNALTPHIVPRDQLLVANAVMSATWSALLAIGAGLGGLATDAIGVDAVYVVDAFSYLLSAAMVLRVPKPPRIALDSDAPLFRAAWTSIGQGARYLVKRGDVGRIALAKACWASGGGAFLFLLTQMGEEMSPVAPATAMGFLYAARGVGTGVGPILARARVADPRNWPPLIGLLLLAGGACYLVLSPIAWGVVTVLLITLAHTCSGANWVMSTVLLQMRADDAFQGRVFAAEWMVLTLTDTVSIFAVSAAMERGWLDLREAIAVFALLPVAAGALWLLLVVPAERRFHQAAVSSGDNEPRHG